MPAYLVGGENMIATFFGAGKADINYQLDEQKHDLEVLRGNPSLTQGLIDDLEFKQKWATGVLSFKKSPSPSQREEIMDSFEEWMSAGIGKDRMNILWIEHKEKAHEHIHFTIPQVDLQSGKQVSWFVDSRDGKALKNWQDMINLKYDLEDPRAIENAQAVSKERFKSSPKEKIYSHLQEKFEAGEIKSRDDVLKAVKGLEGFSLARESKNSISVREDGKNKNLRLYGELFKADFNADTFKQKSVMDKLIDWGKSKGPIKAVSLKSKEKDHAKFCTWRGNMMIKRCTRKGSIDKNIHNELEVEVKHDRTAKDLDKSISESIKSCARLAHDVKREIKQTGAKSTEFQRSGHNEIAERIRKVSNTNDQAQQDSGRVSEKLSELKRESKDITQSPLPSREMCERYTRVARQHRALWGLKRQLSRVHGAVKDALQRCSSCESTFRNIRSRLREVLEARKAKEATKNRVTPRNAFASVGMQSFMDDLTKQVKRNAERDQDQDRGQSRGGMSR